MVADLRYTAHSLTELVVADLNVQVIHVHRVTDLVLVFSHGFAHAQGYIKSKYVLMRICSRPKGSRICSCQGYMSHVLGSDVHGTPLDRKDPKS